jgi:hypothetical protein
MLTSEIVLRRFLIASVSFTTLLISCSKKIDTSSVNGETVSNDAAVNKNTGQFVPNELLVKFKAGTSKVSKDKALLRIGGTVAEKILTKNMQRFNDNEGLLLVHTPLAVLEAKDKLKGMEIEFAEPNYIYQHDAVSNDTYYANGSMWGVLGDAINPKNQYGSQANEAWGAGHTGSRTVHVGVIDEGAMFTHTDLAGQIGQTLMILLTALITTAMVTSTTFMAGTSTETTTLRSMEAATIMVRMLAAP